MNLRIWVQDEPLSPDTDQTIYLDIDLHMDLPLSQLIGLALSLAGQAHAMQGGPQLVVNANGVPLTDEQVQQMKAAFADAARKSGRQ
jgi:hypothetical protein